MTSLLPSLLLLSSICLSGNALRLSADLVESPPTSPEKRKIDQVFISVLERRTDRKNFVLDSVKKAGIPQDLIKIKNSYDAWQVKECLAEASKKDPELLSIKRTTPIDMCGLDVARRVGVSPPTDPGPLWPGTQLNEDKYYNIETGAWGQVGCSVSHAEIWEEIAARPGNDFSLVVEDDAVFLPGAKGKSWWDVANELLGHVDEGTSYVYVGSCHGGAPKTDPLFISSNRWCTHGYAVTPKGARILREKLMNSIISGDKEMKDDQTSPEKGWNTTHGMRVPADFITVWYSVDWLNAIAINRDRAEKEGFIDLSNFDRENLCMGERDGGIICQSNKINSAINAPTEEEKKAYEEEKNTEAKFLRKDMTEEVINNKPF